MLQNLLEMPKMIRYALLCMLEVVEGRLRVEDAGKSQCSSSANLKPAKSTALRLRLDRGDDVG